MTLEARQAQLAVLRRMTAEQKLRQAAELRQAAWTLKASAIRRVHRNVDDREVERRVRQIFLDAGT